MAMGALRRTLEPQLAPRSASAYIERKTDRYRLYPGMGISIDAEEFSDTITRAESNKNSSEKKLETCIFAESIYRGPFLEEDRYEDWCIQKRERFTAGYLNILNKIVTIYETQKEVENAIRFTQKILEADPFDEKAYQKLMTFYAGYGSLSKTKQNKTNIS